MNRRSERFQAADAECVVDFVMNLEEDVTSLPLLALEKAVLFLISPSNRGDNLANLIDVIATFMMLVHLCSLINVHSSSEILNAVQRDIGVLVNQIIVYSSTDAIKSAASEIVSVGIHAVIDDGIFNQFF